MYIAGAAFIAMVAVFVATFDWGLDRDADPGSVVVRTPRPSRPAVPVTPVTVPTEQQKPAPAEVGQEVANIPEPPREVTYEQAETAYNERRYEEATELFTLYTGQKSDNPWGHYMLGLSAWKSKDHEKAEAAFGRALALDDKHVKSYINLGRVLLDTNRPGEALVCIDGALAIDAESGAAFRLRGRALHQLGQVDDAAAAYRRAIRINDQDAWSMNNMALLLIEQERFDEAVPALARAIELRDDVAVFRNNLGMALENTGFIRDAEDAYEAAVSIDGSYAKALANYERVSVVLGDPAAGPVDLAAAATRFVEEIATWVVATDGAEPGDTTEAATPAILITAADESDPIEPAEAGSDTTDIDG
jgi:tetratricopeptide (TPR) repeat protein